MNKIAQFAVQSVFDLAWLGKWTAIFTAGILGYAVAATSLVDMSRSHTFVEASSGFCDSGCD